MLRLGIKETDKAITDLVGIIQDPAIREFTRCLCAALRRGGKGDGKGARKQNDAKYFYNTVSHTRATLYFASKLCCTYSVNGFKRDAVLSAIILNMVEMRVSNEAERKFSGMVPGKPIIASCLAVLKCNEENRVFPEEYNLFERIVLLATVLATEKSIICMEISDIPLEPFVHRYRV